MEVAMLKSENDSYKGLIDDVLNKNGKIETENEKLKKELAN
jgi:FtsZ-binding cell division protein ZapB